jgi:hypothetical protein
VNDKAAEGMTRPLQVRPISHLTRRVTSQHPPAEMEEAAARTRSLCYSEKSISLTFFNRTTRLLLCNDIWIPLSERTSLKRVIFF